MVAGSRSLGSAIDYYAPNYSRLLVFRLGGSAQLPPKLAVQLPVLDPPPEFGTPETTAHGQALFNRFCATCHGLDGQSRGTFPDLRYSLALKDADTLERIVRGGILSRNGMASFASVVDAGGVEAIRAYLVKQATQARGRQGSATAGSH